MHIIAAKQTQLQLVTLHDLSMAALLMPLDYEMQNIATKCYSKASKGIGNPKEMGFVLSRAALPQIYVS